MPATNLALAVLLLLVVPGFLTRTVISSSIPRQQRSGDEWLAEVAGFGAISAVISIVIFALMAWIINVPTPDLGNVIPAQMPFFAVALLYMLCGVLIPIGLGFVVVGLIQGGRLQSLYRALGVPYHHPAPRAWDWYFSQQHQRGVVVTLTDGSKVAGFMGLSSFAASFPANEDLFLEIAYELDGKVIGKPLPHSGGIWIQGSQIRLIEFYVPLALESPAEAPSERESRQN